ncbi:hypothetical protein GGTG_06872 [Gaeumannomyces tritici R3-111a-1]|uniref:Uncharacterized protein n=1 Tax=Gaeumannomyces tritici (strain R3-111a-1) TaxID=644352 RepID=J3P025_GAET3|nr:hypothetical protein GGTG_06872 [Gaeumannomyces tritici R3-111a-1]EJT76958.1 hypothetical protein GGTG_06872 [Gaeumannomyces tritici R3-111a-1]
MAAPGGLGPHGIAWLASGPLGSRAGDAHWIGDHQQRLGSEWAGRCSPPVIMESSQIGGNGSRRLANNKSLLRLSPQTHTGDSTARAIYWSVHKTEHSPPAAAIPRGSPGPQGRRRSKERAKHGSLPPVRLRKAFCAYVSGVRPDDDDDADADDAMPPLPAQQTRTA